MKRKIDKRWWILMDLIAWPMIAGSMLISWALVFHLHHGWTWSTILFGAAAVICFATSATAWYLEKRDY